MEVLFPQTINKVAHKALEDTTNAGKTYAQSWEEKKKIKKREGRKKKKNNIVMPEGEKHFPCE